MTRRGGPGLPTTLLAVIILASSCTLTGDAVQVPMADRELTVNSAVGDTLAFVPDTVTAKHGETVRITFRNVSSLDHNLTLQAPISVGTRTIVEAGSTDAVTLLTPGPGQYVFVCTIHMGMSGTLAVE